MEETEFSLEHFPPHFLAGVYPSVASKNNS